MKKKRHVGQNFPSPVADALAGAAVRQYGPSHLRRGGAVGRAHAERRRGQSIQAAARVASRQGKGLAGELRLAAEQTLDAGARGSRFVTQPNTIANDRHVDLEVLDGPVRVDHAQVGVGRVRYVRPKAHSSQASQVIINVEAREQLRDVDPWAYDRTTDRLQYGETSSRPLREATVTEDAKQVLEHVLSGSARLDEWFRIAAAATGGAEAAVTAFGRAALFGLVDRWLNGKPIDISIVNDALDVGCDAFVKTAAQSYILVSDFLDAAGAIFDCRLLHSIGGKIVTAGAIADVLVSTGRDMIALINGEITLDEVIRRALVAVLAALGTVAGWQLAAKLTAGAPAWVSILVTLALTWGGGWLAAQLGEALTEPPPAHLPPPAPIKL